MNITNIGRYRVTDYERRGLFTLYNTTTDRVYDITREEYESIRDHMSLAACEFVEDKYAGTILRNAYAFG